MNDPDEAGEARDVGADEAYAANVEAKHDDCNSLEEASDDTGDNSDSNSDDADGVAGEVKLDIALEGELLGHLAEDTEVVGDVAKPIRLGWRAHDWASMGRRPRVRSSSNRRPRPQQSAGRGAGAGAGGGACRAILPADLDTASLLKSQSLAPRRRHLRGSPSDAQRARQLSRSRSAPWVAPRAERSPGASSARADRRPQVCYSARRRSTIGDPRSSGARPR